MYPHARLHHDKKGDDDKNTHEDVPPIHIEIPQVAFVWYISVFVW